MTSFSRAMGAEFATGRNGLLAAAPDLVLVGHVAFAAGVELSALHRQRKGLEDAFLALVKENGGESR